MSIADGFSLWFGVMLAKVAISSLVAVVIAAAIGILLWLEKRP